jgi:hypothetical protein
MGGAGQHAIFRRYPSFALAAQKRRYPFFYRSCDQDAGVAETDKNGAFGMLGEMGFDTDSAHFVWRAS